MADVSIIRGKTLPDSGIKNDLHELIDLATGTVSNIVNTDIKSSAAIAGSKISPNFGSQDVVCAKVTASDDVSCAENVAISGTTDLGSQLTLTGALDVTGNVDVTGDVDLTGDVDITGDVTIDGNCAIFGAWDNSSWSNNTAYLASTDLLVCAYASGAPNSSMIGYTDENSSPTTIRCYNTNDDQNGTGRACITMPVKKGHYWKVNGSTFVACNVLPIG